MTALAGNTPVANIFNGANQMAGASYDGAGNQTGVNGNTLVYNAENRLVSVTEPASLGGGTETFAYDGAGRRVEKTMAGGTTVYVFDAFGQLAAEYATTAPFSNPCVTCYVTADHLGSTRLVTDANANVIARHDFLPFGEEIAAGTAGRNSQWAPGGDNVEQKFTGQIRDQETGLDYFHARYLGAALGRFTSPDPGNAGADVTNPQSWNGYAYARNNPLAFTDPTGMTVTCSTDSNGNFSCYDDDPQPSGGGGNDQPPDLESTCWWCWEYGYPYTGPSQPAQPAQPVQPIQPPHSWRPPSNPGTCVAQFTGLGAGVGAGVGAFVGGGIGAGGGAAIGATGGTFVAPVVGTVGGGIAGGIAGEAAGSIAGGLVGGSVGAGAGYLLGNIICSTGTGGGGGGLTPGARKKLGNLASRAGERVRDVIRSRGGTAANVNQAGQWADKTLGETAQAAANGDPTAETAIKIAKQAGRLGQIY